ncbi:hypothetical protein HGM15179_015733 [Zosterops borbonicus]|uniref:Uncharacterized protein n=1 Tax=Zosterops borbonicus TaxID=364589 RepID=A0A8K1G402_9PASS|nr:hypothetical protein HGM15179_015733 [Zosterops borbonicus]
MDGLESGGEWSDIQLGLGTVGASQGFVLVFHFFIEDDDEGIKGPLSQFLTAPGWWECGSAGGQEGSAEGFRQAGSMARGQWGEVQPGEELGPALGSQQPLQLQAGGKVAGKLEKALGVLLTAAGHQPRGAQVAKKANGPWAVPAMMWQQEQGSDCPCAGTAEGPPPILEAALGPSQQGIEGLECVQRRERNWGRVWSPRRG